MNTRPRLKRSSPVREKSAARKVLAEWRGVDLTELEEEQAAQARPASQVVPALLQELGLDRRRAEAEVLKVWNHLLDPHIVKHAQPTGLVRGTLYVTIDSPVWRDEIVRYRRHEILERLQHSFGRDLIGKVCFRVG